MSTNHSFVIRHSSFVIALAAFAASALSAFAYEPYVMEKAAEFNAVKRDPNLPRAISPVPQMTDTNRNWDLHNGYAACVPWVKMYTATNPPYDVIFLGDSITACWGGPGREVWNRHFSGKDGAPYRCLNIGMDGDRTENLLWRIQYEEWSGKAPKAFVVMIGTNNGGDEYPVEDVAEGIRLILGELRTRFPTSTVILHPIFPRGGTNDVRRLKNERVNAEIRKFAVPPVRLVDFNAKFLNPDGTLVKGAFYDGLHPGKLGFEIWAENLLPVLREVLGR